MEIKKVGKNGANIIVVSDKYKNFTSKYFTNLCKLIDENDNMKYCKLVDRLKHNYEQVINIIENLLTKPSRFTVEHKVAFFQKMRPHCGQSYTYNTLLFVLGKCQKEEWLTNDKNKLKNKIESLAIAINMIEESKKIKSKNNGLDTDTFLETYFDPIFEAKSRDQVLEVIDRIKKEASKLKSTEMFEAKNKIEIKTTKNKKSKSKESLNMDENLGTGENRQINDLGNEMDDSKEDKGDYLNQPQNKNFNSELEEKNKTTEISIGHKNNASMSTLLLKYAELGSEIYNIDNKPYANEKISKIVYKIDEIINEIKGFSRDDSSGIKETGSNMFIGDNNQNSIGHDHDDIGGCNNNNFLNNGEPAGMSFGRDGFGYMNNIINYDNRQNTFEQGGLQLRNEYDDFIYRQIN